MNQRHHDRHHSGTMRSLLVPLLLCAGCASPIIEHDSGIVLHDAGTEVDAGNPPPPDAGEIDAGPSCLPLETIDRDAADAGLVFLFSDDIGGAFIPRQAWDTLWLVWGVGAKPGNYAAAMRARYGFVEALTSNDDLPIGLRQVGATIHADCLVCHAGAVAGQTVIGAPNTRLDLALFVDDLKALAQFAGLPAPNTPTIRTGARGVSDIIGMTLQLASSQQTPPFAVNTEIGFQDPPAWWGLKTKTRVYTDGSAPQSGHRTFMATQLAFGATQAQLEALEPKYVQLRQLMLALDAPGWPFAAPEPARVARGQAIYRAQCVSCHRDDRCERQESMIVPRAEIDTDPVRSAQYGANEIALINSSWFGSTNPHQVTGGYIAPSLRGVWASAPYFHNASVPTLEGVLDSSKRPAFFQIVDGYDEAGVGLKVETFTSAPASPPRATRAAVYDTTKAGLGNTGHRYGDALSGDERAALIEFLKTL